jgi:DNA mismatch endonuclease (patch repair protein)
MAQTGRRDTKPEIQIRRLLHARGLRYRVDQPVLAGVRRRADLVFRTARVVVFVDGCFWHGCPEHATWPKNNAEFWREKIETNQRRDRDTDQRLADAGWRVAHVWEHEDPADAAERIQQLVMTAV